MLEKAYPWRSPQIRYRSVYKCCHNEQRIGTYVVQDKSIYRRVRLLFGFESVS